MLIFILIVTGCFNNNDSKDKIYLEDKYYGSTEFKSINTNQFEEMIKNKESFVLYTYNFYCILPISCETIFKEFMEENKISFNSLKFEDLKKTSIYDHVKYAPSIIIFNDGELVTYLDPDSQEDLNYFQDIDEFTKWITSYINLNPEN